MTRRGMRMTSGGLPRAAWPCWLVLAAASPAQSPPEFEVTTINSVTVRGTLTAADGVVHVRPATGEPVAIGIADLALVTRVDAAAPPTPPTPAPMAVWLRSGAVLPATGIEGTPAGGARGPRWIVTTAAGAVLDLPQSAVAAVRCRTVEPTTFAADRQQPDRDADYLYVVKEGKPQRFRVTVAALDAQRLRFAMGGRDYDFPLIGTDSVAALVFGRNTGFAPDRLAKPRVGITLRTGERCEARLDSIDAVLSATLAEGARLSVPIAAVASIEVASDKLTWLGTLTPHVEQTPAFDRTWPWTVDASPAGPGIQLDGRSFAHGLVLVPRTRLTYDLGGRFDAFEATIGIDDRGGPLAHAIVRVFGDGRLLYESPPLIRGGTPQVLRIELSACSQLALEADFGKNFDLGDLCAFADARVVQN